jgi:CubicO group peptidase (beta-lactamase class C family)
MGCSHLPSTLPLRAFNEQHVDETVTLAMAATGARGLALSVVENGKVVFTKAYGVRSSTGDPLRGDTVMFPIAVGSARPLLAGSDP